MDSGVHSGGMEILITNWDKYGGLLYAPEPYLATELQQIQVAKNIQGKYPPPDQHGCTRGGW
jgi:hypothetical protein